MAEASKIEWTDSTIDRSATGRTLGAYESAAAKCGVRGLLCQGCNTAIGLLGENPELFASALTYLERHRG